MAQIDLRNPPNEFPDIVGYEAGEPDSRQLPAFHSGTRATARIDAVAAHHRHAARDGLRRVVALSRAQSRADGKCVHSGGGDLDHDLPPAFQVRSARLDCAREQHRANRRLGRRINRVRSRRDHACNHDSRVRSRDHARHARRDSRRTDWNPDDDSAAPRAHRAAARLL